MTAAALIGIRKCLPILGLAAALLVQPALAMVVSSDDGLTSVTTTAPADDFGFANVGKKGTTTGVYLGYRWVLTAAHVSATEITLNGVTYAVEPGTDQRLLNPTGLGMSTYTDLRLYRIVESPRLPVLTISATWPGAVKDVVMVGAGYDRQATTTAWDVVDNGNTQTWTITDPPGDRRGYRISGTQNLRWGTNRLDNYNSIVSVGTDNDIIALRTTYNEVGGTTHEAQAVNRDSGGSLFYKRAGKWELAGILSAVGPAQGDKTGAPSAVSNAVFLYQSYFVNLAEYRDQILDIIAPLPGDANLDDVVNDADAAVLAQNWLMSSGALWEDGDFNRDGMVNDMDAAILAAHWRRGGESLGVVPEPTVATLLLAAVVTLLLRRRFTNS